MKVKLSGFFVFFLFCCLIFKTSLAANSNFLKEPFGEYIVVLEDEPSPYHSADHTQFILEELEKKVTILGGRILHFYSKVFFGAHVRLAPVSVSLLKRDSWVKVVAKNDLITLSGGPLGVKSWGLDRIDQKETILDEAYVVPYTGKGVHAYVLDTGLRASHDEFEGRVGDGFSSCGEDCLAFEDCNGHGTHVAGTILGTEAGVAKEAIIHPVRVFKCLGSTTLDMILSGMEWVVQNHKKPAVLNMSLGGPQNEAWDQAVKNTTEAGVHVVVAAGNSNKNACQGSPARAPEAITVAASTKADKLAGFSNWGECVDIIAPGMQITSASRVSDDAFLDLSGTSMASPHVAGAAALVLQMAPGLSPSELETYLAEHGLKDKIADSKGAPNSLLHVSGFLGYPRVLVGRNQLIRLPQTEAAFLGQAEDYDGEITGTGWTQILGPEVDIKSSRNFVWEHELKLENLAVGDYGFRFTVKDDSNYNLFQDSYLSVRDENTLPVADAGYTNKVSVTERMLLDGTGSYDRDGNIISYLWEQLEGPSQGDILDPTSASTRVDGTVSGSYKFQLKIKDNEAGTSKDTVNIAVNFPPLVDAGEDQRLEATSTSTVLNGSLEDLDGIISVSLWTQRSGPNEATIVTEYDSPSTEVINLKEGTYVFELIAMDDTEDIIRDTVNVVVEGEGEGPVWPKVDAGEDQTIQLPQDSATLVGRCEAEEGICVSTSWALASSSLSPFKPGGEVESGGIESNLRLKNLKAGVYNFRFTGKDAEGNESSDEVTLTVLSN